ncbi:MAG: hypothetical protein ACLP9S_02720 [Syntrophales bacterium]
MVRQAYSQGDLDGFCGIYATVNAIRLIDRRMRGDKSVVLFRRLLRCLERRSTLSNIATEGLSVYELQYMLNKVVIRHYGIRITRPFRWSRMPSTDDFFDEVSAYLKEYPRRAVICSIDEHWSVLKHVTEKQVHFFDSTRMRRVHRKKCTITRVSSRRPYFFDKKEVFFLEK